MGHFFWDTLYLSKYLSEVTSESPQLQVCSLRGGAEGNGQPALLQVHVSISLSISQYLNISTSQHLNISTSLYPNVLPPTQLQTHSNTIFTSFIWIRRPSAFILIINISYLSTTTGTVETVERQYLHTI